MHQTGTYLQRRKLCSRLWQAETRCQTAVDKPSLRKTNFHSRCHGSSIFCCLEDTIFRRVQLHAGVTVWEDKWRSSLSFLFPQPSMAPLCLGNNRGETFEKLHVWLWKVFLRCGRESNVSVCCCCCCGIQISADAIHSKSLSTYVSQFIFPIHVCIYANEWVKLTQVNAAVSAKTPFKFTSEASFTTPCTSEAAT